MSNSGGPPSDDGARSLVSRDLLLVGLAILALIVAAFAVPPIQASVGGPGSGPAPGGQNGTDTSASTPTPGESPGGPGSNDGEPGSGPDGGPGGQPGGDSANVRVVGNGTGDGGNSSLDLRGAGPHPDCFVIVWDRLVPGSEATVLRWQDGRLATDRPVWFDDRLVGRTGVDGRVDGRVPYLRSLPLTAGVGDVESCRLAHLEKETDFDEWRRANGPARIVVENADALETLERADRNVSTTLPVGGTASLEIEGEPYPGETVRLNATVDGVPMRSATVSADGRAVGETDDRGLADLTIPDDGTERLAVQVSRGDFAAEETIDVLLLSIDVRPQRPLAVPGGEASVVVTVGDRPAEDVTVSIDGERKATTGTSGRATIELPADPRAAVHASGHGQTTSAPIWPLYLPTLLVALVALGAVVGSLALSTRRGSQTTRTVAGAWLGVAVLAVAGIVGGRLGVAIALGVGGLVGLVLAAVVYRSAVRRWLVSAAGVVLLAALGVRRLAIGLADWLGWLADRALAVGRAAIGRVRGLPRSIGGILALARGWLATVPGRLGAGARRVGSVLRRWILSLGSTLRTPRGAAGLIVAFGLVAAGYLLADEAGALAAGGAVLALVLVDRWRRSGESPGSPGPAGQPTPDSGPGGGSGGGSSPSRVSLRTLWRTFARWVVPGRWRSRTPGEVARAAVDRGFPREPVQGFTEVFREVEYGNRTLSEERWGRARAAFDALGATRSDEEDGER